MVQLTGAIPTDHALTLLQRLVPPGAVIHIGSGIGVGQMHSWRNWGVPRALLLDAAYGVHQPAWFNPDTAPPGWSYEAALLSDRDGTTCMYQASNPAESGLLKPEELNMIWPNLSTKEQEQRPVTRLESLLAEPRHTELRAAANIWCMVDCLPALPILQGAGAELQNWSVLWLRVLLKPFDGELQQANLPACQELLEPLGFHCLQINESNHPALGDAIFVRDWAAWLQPRLALQEKLAADEHTQLKELSDAKEQSMQQLEELTAARNEQARLADERQASVKQLQQEQEAFSNLAAERLAQMEQLTAARNEQARLADVRQSECNTLKIRLQEVENSKAMLESQLAELEHRQQLMNEEMVKAEGQIDLIKDLLLREPGL